MIIEIKENEIKAMKWLLLKGMEQTNSDRKFEIFERLSDELHQSPERVSVDAVVSGWIEIEGNEVLYSQVCSDDTMIKFDDGSECRYADDWSFAKATHFKIKESH